MRRLKSLVYTIVMKLALSAASSAGIYSCENISFNPEANAWVVFQQLLDYVAGYVTFGF